MTINKEPYTIRWNEQSPGKRIDVVDVNQNVVATFTLSNLFQFAGMWGSPDKGGTWTPIWIDEKLGTIHTDGLPSTATVVYTRNADNYITSEVHTLAGITITITYTRNADNYITKREVLVVC